MLQTLRAIPGYAEFLRSGLALTPANFGIKYVRWPYDPAVSAGGGLTSSVPSRWQSELDGRIGWIRAFDPSLHGRYVGGAFVQVGMTAEASSVPYGRMEGGTWYQGMLRADGSYDWSKLDLLLASARAKGCRVLMSIGAQGEYYDGARHTEYPLPTGEYRSLDPDAYYARWIKFLDALLDRGGDRIAGIEVANEPGKLVRRNTVIGPGWTESLSIKCRILKQLVRAKRLQTLVVSPPFQGGEYGEVKAFLTASAAGPALYGVDGTGTVGRDWIDVCAHHLYGNFADRAAGGSTAALDAAGFNDVAADAAYPANTTFADILAKAAGVRSNAIAGGWRGPLWNTEFNCTGSVGTSAWCPRKLTQSGFERVIMQAMIGSFLGGFDLAVWYAADHPALGLFDNTGSVPVGEPADWHFKAPDNTARGAAALASVIGILTAGEFAGGRTDGYPWFAAGARPRVSKTGVFS